MQRHSPAHPCPICEGHERMPQGHGKRCWGFVSEEGDYAVCHREELAGPIGLNPKSNGYHHKLNGPCRCGVIHGPAESAEVRELGEARRAEIVATYDYTDAAGKLLYQVLRYHPKTFKQRKPDGAGGWAWKLGDVERVPYRLPEVLAAVEAGDTVYIAEGEKDVNALRDAGAVATCNMGGASNWPQSASHYLRGANVIIVRDRDEEGHKHARDLWRKLKDAAASIRVVEAREGKDASDHLAAGHGLEAFVPVWPVDRRSNPVQWKQAMLRRSLDPGDPFQRIDFDAALQVKTPTWPTGLETNPGSEVPKKLPNFRGVVILTGRPSSGKSLLAVSSGVQACFAGWDVIYLSAEMDKATLARRVQAYCMGAPPEGFHVEEVGFGASLEALVDLLCERVSAKRTLVVFDSVSSFVDQSLEERSAHDTHGIGPSKRLVMWAINTKRNTEGDVSFLLLSETNKDGETKGRFGDHKADLVLTLKPDAEIARLKDIVITKGWEYQTGKLGQFNVNAERALLEEWK